MCDQSRRMKALSAGRGKAVVAGRKRWSAN